MLNIDVEDDNSTAAETHRHEFFAGGPVGYIEATACDDTVQVKIHSGDSIWEFNVEVTAPPPQTMLKSVFVIADHATDSLRF